MAENQESPDPDEPRRAVRREERPTTEERRSDRDADDLPGERRAMGENHGETDSDETLPEPLSTPVLAGQIEREHAAFVVLGALAMVAVCLQLTGIWL